MNAAVILGAIFAAITAIGGGVGLASLRKVREERKDLQATTDLKITEAAGRAVDLVTDKFDFLKAELDDTRKQLSREREEKLEALAREARTAAELAGARADKAELEARASHERHEMRSEITARDLRIDALEREVAQLRDEIESFRAQRGDIERRRSDRRDP